MNIKYITRVITGLKIERIRECVDTVHKKSGKNRAATLADMLWCSVRYGAGFHDYIISEYNNLTGAQRKTYMTRVKNKKLVTMVNDERYMHFFDNKDEFYEKFTKYLKRNYLVISKADLAAVAKFMQGKEYLIAKPSDGQCGEGIEKLKLSDFADSEALYRYLKDPEKNFGVVEDLIIQHEALSRLYPFSVNCIRFVTLVHEGKSHVLYAVLKTGNNGKFVDNYMSGGYSCVVDLNTGIVIGDGHPETLEVSRVHPATGVAFRGLQVPFFKEAIALVNQAALEIPQVGYIGWDVCFTPTGPAIIEGNNYSAYDFSQVPDKGRENIGILSLVNEIGIKL
ncbi:MAG: sugar-transfer associated ATP-grasp domain-containing protein [Oscillospiraceae bacterium]